MGPAKLLTSLVLHLTSSSQLYSCSRQFRTFSPPFSAGPQRHSLGVPDLLPVEFEHSCFKPENPEQVLSGSLTSSCVVGTPTIRTVSYPRRGGVVGRGSRSSSSILITHH